jgi:hypothetical protein
VLERIFAQEADFHGTRHTRRLEEQGRDLTLGPQIHSCLGDDEQIDIAAIRVEAAHRQRAMQIDAHEASMEDPSDLRCEGLDLPAHLRGTVRPSELSHVHSFDVEPRPVFAATYNRCDTRCRAVRDRGAPNYT